MSWKPEIKVVNDDKWYPNGLTFETKEEAERSARSTFNGWTTAVDHRAVESDLPPNYRWTDKGLEAITDEGAISNDNSAPSGVQDGGDNGDTISNYAKGSD